MNMLENGAVVTAFETRDRAQTLDAYRRTSPLRLRVKLLRAAMGMTQQQLSTYLHVSWVTVNRWENGKTEPSPLAVYAIGTCEDEHWPFNVPDETR